MNFSLFEESRKGRRPYNQDRVGHWRTGQALLMAVADGMGGYAGGELAAQVALNTVAGLFLNHARPQLSDPRSFLLRAFDAAHVAILNEGKRAGLGDSPRTTLVACVVQAGYVHWSFVGDSRLYLMRDGRLLARTRDHTRVQQLVDAGRIREEAVAAHPERNQLLRSLGGAVAGAAEPVASARVARGDVILLCSDGLWGPLTPRRLLIEFIGKAPKQALPTLMALAEAHAGRGCDNLTAVAMQWLEDAVADDSLERTLPGGFVFRAA